MKLLSKTSLLIITASIFIFWAGNIVFFHVSKDMISKQINSDLMERMSNFVNGMENTGSRSGDVEFSGQFSVADKLVPEPIKPAFSDTVLFSSAQNRYITHRALTFSVGAGGTEDGFMKITLYKSLLSSDRLIERISIASIILLITFIVMIFILNRFIFSNVWAGFSDSLEEISNYDFKDLEKLRLSGSEIDEFERLNRVLVEMADRIQSDYRSLKELTANTSHEIQTPLAIIKNKAEILLQSDRLGQEEMEIVSSIISTTGRLSKLNQSLLLIARIENNQYEESESIELTAALGRYIDNMEGMIEAGGFTISLSLDSFRVVMNPVLLDILISNLVKNAITHGTRGTEIQISLADGELSIANRGEPLPFASDQIFKRFIRGSTGSGSTGIGLEIVRKVCNYYRIEVGHSFVEGMHHFVVDFGPLSESAVIKNRKK